MPKWKVPLMGLPPRCVRCLFACPRCDALGNVSRLRMARLVEDLVYHRIEWFPHWRRLELSKVED